jgi:hypothetical protein
MAKLTLDPNALKVETFEASATLAAARGTVQAFDASKPSCVSCGGYTDPCICDPIHPLTPLC